MTRMGADGYSSAGSTQISVKANSDLKNDFQEACEENGETMTDVIEEAMREYVELQGDGSKGDDLPTDDTLRQGYQTLRSLSDPDRNQVPTDTARSKVSESTGVAKGDVRRCVLEPLERRGYINPQYGKLYVVPPYERRGDPTEAAE